MKYSPLLPMWTGTEVVFANFSEGTIYRAAVNPALEPNPSIIWVKDHVLAQPVFEEVKATQEALEANVPEEVFYDALDTQKRLRATKPPTFEGQPTCRKKE